MSLRFLLAGLLFPLAWAVPAGIGTASVLTVPLFEAQAATLLPYVGAESFVLGAALAWHLAGAVLAAPSPPALAPARPWTRNGAAHSPRRA